MSTVYLTTEEKERWEKLPSNFIENITVENETMQFADSPEKITIRMRNLKVEHPSLVALREHAKDVQTADDFKNALESIDLEALPENDLMELYFAMGPELIGSIIKESIGDIASSDDAESFASLTFVRHGLLLSLSDSPNA